MKMNCKGNWLPTARIECRCGRWFEVPIRVDDQIVKCPSCEYPNIVPGDPGLYRMILGVPQEKLPPIHEGHSGRKGG